MYNYFMLIGTLEKDVEIFEYKDGKRCALLHMSVLRDFKNPDGSVASDRISIKAWEITAEIASDILKKGCKFGVKGRIRPNNYKREGDDRTIYTYDLIADRIIAFSNEENSLSTTNENA